MEQQEEDEEEQKQKEDVELEENERQVKEKGEVVVQLQLDKWNKEQEEKQKGAVPASCQSSLCTRSSQTLLPLVTASLFSQLAPPSRRTSHNQHLLRPPAGDTLREQRQWEQLRSGYAPAAPSISTRRHQQALLRPWYSSAPPWPRLLPSAGSAACPVSLPRTATT